ncbi:MAG: hypothetical protein QF436_00520 [Candidatus Woesearchaeota archaeon]|jgi:hypothetical protein|nr:hypothetical protein [Candidatus Woesearchaeota archaeon]MDP7622582.1 hypothetical protein [Candidatus Woesearchaeota archaeon]|tara:strand:- start:23082 stop:23795 length:714 start_codon:yes stop_codon:yes gene_type:complete
MLIMDIGETFTKKRVIFILLFAVFAFITQRINFSPLVGAENQFFTLFQFFGPIAGAFLGPVFGVIAVFLAELVDFIVVGKELTLINIMRFAPMLFATYYFASNKKRLNAIIPLIAIGLFVLHPVGRQVWFFALFGTIPIIATLLTKKYSMSVPLRSLGATFTAQSIGGALWVWTVPMTAGQWIALIPVVAYERVLFALGIGISFIVLNALLNKVLVKLNLRIPSDVLRIEKKFTLKA